LTGISVPVPAKRSRHISAAAASNSPDAKKAEISSLICSSSRLASSTSMFFLRR
jgi:hypothetical protein